ncbi:hypothetical protein [Bacillus licheniformis]|nr:hypothetical protein [Bacillus licheniformis]OJT57393.1 hypothetical protein BFP47_11855 [Bacillus licheniformis]OJT69965.1 hypothetical protein BFP46_05035 [Bacillus licheniformis]GIN25455.1 hypothetical protein J31TS2_20350 [Bacillus licheniformis]GIN29806.1 hypothetical protein J2TS5_18450 [Bacillus licheniformis]
MNPDYKNSHKVLFNINNTQAIEMESVKTTQTIQTDKEIKNGEDIVIFNKETILRIENIQFDAGKLTTPNQKFTVIGTGYKFPRGRSLPKKKRIRKKWMKKYSYEFELKDCMIF